MKICITSKGNSLDSPAERSFGRSPYFIIVDDETGEEKSIANENVDATGGVGPKSAQLLINNDVNVLITGQMGGNAQRAVEVSGIEVYQYKDGGSVREALNLYKEGNLEKIL